MRDCALQQGRSILWLITLCGFGNETNQPYDSVRIVLTGVLADALLNLNVLQTGLHRFSGSISGEF